MRLNYNVKIMHVLDRSFAVLSNPGERVRTLSLNPTSTDMLQALADGLDEDGVVERMLTIYDAPDDTMRHDVHSFIGNLAEKGIVSL